jgi:hypothetical protein
MLQLLHSNSPFTVYSILQLVLTPCAVERCQDYAFSAAVLQQGILSAVKCMLCEQLLLRIGSHYSSITLVVYTLHVLVKLSLVAVALVARHVLVGEILANGLFFLLREDLNFESLLISFLKPWVLLYRFHCDSL